MANLEHLLLFILLGLVLLVVGIVSSGPTRQVVN